jgi:hypothetical protein
MEFIKKYIKWLVLLACIVAGVGLFLPMCTVSMDLLGYSFSETIVFVEHDGMIVLAALIISVIFVIGFAYNFKTEILTAKKSVVFIAGIVLLNIFAPGYSMR